jgi:histidine ammonia-lyase
MACALLVAGAALATQAGAAWAYNPITPTQADRTITLDGRTMSVEDVVAVARHGAKVQLAPQARQRSADAYELLLEGARQNMPIYWFNRGAGSGRETVIFEGDPMSPENRQLLLDRQLQRFRAYTRGGIGPEVADEEITRAMMVVRANTMVYEAATPEMTQMLLDLINKRISPVVQSRGTPGEGDLPQMGHVGGTMVGAGEAYLNGQRMPAGQALAQAGLEPLRPFAADDAALTSSNAYTVGQTALLLHDAKRMLDWSDLTFSMSMLGLNSSVTPLTAVPQAIRPFPYHNWQSRRLLNIIRGSYLFDHEQDIGRIIQDPLSFRDYNQRNGALWQAYDQLRRDTNIQLNSSDHNPAVMPGSKPTDSWELDTPWLRRYYVEGDSISGYILSNSNFNVTTLNNDTQAFVMALAESLAGTAQRVLRLEDTFFTVVAPADVLSEEVLAQAPPRGGSYQISDLMAELQALANPIPAQGNALVRNVEDMEAFGRQKVARARLAVDTAMYLIGQELLSASYWMDVRRVQKPSRSFGGPATTALQALRAVIPWQQAERPETPAGNLVHAFMSANPASAFIGADAAGPEVRAAKVRSATSKARSKARSRTRALRTNAREPARAARSDRRR